MQRRIHLHALALALAVGALAPLCVCAADTAARSLAATCTGCHGTNGVSQGGIPSLAGLEQQRIVALLQEFRDGKRPATVMHQHAKGYTDQQIEAMAAWFAAQK
jgi:cytochrome subunit of sulfide dehydrogenase